VRYLTNDARTKNKLKIANIMLQSCCVACVRAEPAKIAITKMRLVLLVCVLVSVQGECDSAGLLGQDNFIPKVSQRGYVMGSRDASVIIDVFFDHVCPDTASAWPVLNQLLTVYTSSQVSLVWRVMPLPYHYYSLQTAIGGRVIYSLFGVQQFFAYTGLVFNNATLMGIQWNRDITQNAYVDLMAGVGCKSWPPLTLLNRHGSAKVPD
jgi:hypothetical protein